VAKGELLDTVVYVLTEKGSAALAK
jgi:hypothetical protein